MPSVVLTGFSTVGKSTLGKRLEDEFGTQITLLDSDVYVAEKHHGHIYNIFYEMTVGSNTQAAMNYILARQDEFLKGIADAAHPQVVIAGPWLHRSAFWKPFVDRLKPTCILITISPEKATDGLLRRRKAHEDSEVGLNPLFGCWDNGVTTKYSLQKCRWIQIPYSDAVTNVSRLMKSANYETIAHDVVEYEAPEDDKISLIRTRLGI
jgi:hypothetical protein